MLDQVTQAAATSRTTLPIFEWLIFAATLLGPIAAVLVTRLIDNLRHKALQREWVFRTLMATRDGNLNPTREHVEALHMIEVVFRRTKDKPICDAWRLYYQHLHITPSTPDEQSRWADRRADLYASLLFLISKRLKYKLSEVQIREVYSPKAFGWKEAVETSVWNGLRDVVTGVSPLGVRLVSAEEDQPAKMAFARLVSGESPLAVKVVTSEHKDTEKSEPGPDSHEGRLKSEN